MSSWMRCGRVSLVWERVETKDLEATNSAQNQTSVVLEVRVAV